MYNGEAEAHVMETIEGGDLNGALRLLVGYEQDSAISKGRANVLAQLISDARRASKATQLCVGVGVHGDDEGPTAA